MIVLNSLAYILIIVSMAQLGLAEVKLNCSYYKALNTPNESYGIIPTASSGDDIYTGVQNIILGLVDAVRCPNNNTFYQELQTIYEPLLNKTIKNYNYMYNKSNFIDNMKSIDDKLKQAYLIICKAYIDNITNCCSVKYKDNMCWANLINHKFIPNNTSKRHTRSQPVLVNKIDVLNDIVITDHRLKRSIGSLMKIVKWIPKLFKTSSRSSIGKSIVKIQNAAIPGMILSSADAVVIVITTKHETCVNKQFARDFCKVIFDMNAFLGKISQIDSKCVDAFSKL